MGRRGGRWGWRSGHPDAVKFQFVLHSLVDVDGAVDGLETTVDLLEGGPVIGVPVPT